MRSYGPSLRSRPYKLLIWLRKQKSSTSRRLLVMAEVGPSASPKPLSPWRFPSGSSECSAFPGFRPLSLSDFCLWHGHRSGRPPINHQPVREQDSKHRHKHQWLAHIGFHLHVVMNHACDASHIGQAV